jgi:hypothetical protein
MIALAIPILIIGLTLTLAWPLGHYMRWAMEPAAPGPGRCAYERLGARLLGRFATAEQSWKRYALSMLVFNLALFVLVYVILTTQGLHPLNPDGKTALEPSLAFNSPTNPRLTLRAQALIGRYGLPEGQRIPADLVTASGSGLDPHITLAAARFQAPRVASARSLPLDRVYQLIAQHTDVPALRVFGGEPVVNVLQLNIALDAQTR